VCQARARLNGRLKNTAELAASFDVSWRRPRKPVLKNRVPQDIEGAIVARALSLYYLGLPSPAFFPRLLTAH
jgi:hypothetical protein